MALFGNDPWWIVLVKVLGIFVFLLVLTIFNIWYERRVVGKMQHRKGPIMNGPLGLGQALGDGAKLILKEDFRPAGTDKWVFNLAPILTGAAAFTAWAVIPLGGEVEMFGVRTRLQLTDLPVAVLFVMAIASVGIYGIVLAGWASSSTYSLLGGIRSTAQMISYEIAMGLALVAVFLQAGTMSTSEIVAAQTQPIIPAINFPGWYALLLIPSFVIYVIAMVAECNRAPFDLVECEQELVSGFLTDYSGFRYAAFFLAEYINMATVSGVATTLFLGGYHAPWPLNLIPGIDSGWLGVVWFTAKVLVFMYGFVWLRGTLPRLRYDQLMDLGWKWLLPISLGWIVAIGTVNVLRGTVNILVMMGVILLMAVIAVAILSRVIGDDDKESIMPNAPDKKSRVVEVKAGEFDAFAGGYPVPPMPGQVLPELAGVVRGAGPAAETATATKEA